jgi:hypothetical protein
MRSKGSTRLFQVLAYVSKLLVFSAVLAMITSSDALAYIDPGSGALIWQALLASFFGALFYIRRILNFLIKWIHRYQRNSNKNRT